MEERVLSVAENQFSEIPKDLWAQHVQLRAKEIPKVLDFMTEDHHRVRYFVVRELPRIAKPIPPERIAKEFDLSLSKTNQILQDLEKNLFFLVRNDKGEVLWAYPVTADQTNKLAGKHGRARRIHQSVNRIASRPEAPGAGRPIILKAYAIPAA